MAKAVAETTSTSACTASWLLWPNSSETALPLPRAVDEALEGYRFYPESDWSTFGYRPPENYVVCGSWRDDAGAGFVFLLDRSTNANATAAQFLLQAAGAKHVVEDIEHRVSALKIGLARAEKKLMSVKHADVRLEVERQSPAVTSLIKLVGLFTVLINAFSLYLRQLPAPKLPSPVLESVYEFVVLLVHFLAIGLLLLITLVGVAYAVRYAVLMLRRL